MSSALRSLPAVHAVLRDDAVAALPRDLATHVTRAVLDEARAALLRGAPAPNIVDAVVTGVRALLTGRLRPVWNATGVVLHTNLGRAVWSDAARDAALIAMGNCNLEIDLETGKRGGRLAGIEALCRYLTGCEAAVVVNNGAAAVLLALTAHAHGADVLVSRGELVEIGGSFRVPDVIAAGGARLVEVGTTNRTRKSDFETAGDDARVLLTVHPSNFAMTGFVTTASRTERVAVARSRGLVVVEDAGSGDLDGGRGEPSIRDAVAEGVDVVVFSADKLLGGPQAGIAVGSRDAIATMRRHPMYRALRLDKVTLAALEATLADQAAGRATPTDRMLDTSDEVLNARAERLCDALKSYAIVGRVETVEGATGGGARPDVVLPGFAVRVPVKRADAVHQRLRTGAEPVLARVRDDALWLDVRTLPDDAIDAVAQQVASAMDARYEAPQ